MTTHIVTKGRREAHSRGCAARPYVDGYIRLEPSADVRGVLTDSALLSLLGFAVISLRSPEEPGIRRATGGVPAATRPARPQQSPRP